MDRLQETPAGCAAFRTVQGSAVPSASLVPTGERDRHAVNALTFIKKHMIDWLHIPQSLHSAQSEGPMKLAETKYDNKETGCCARLDEARWDGQEFDWKDKPFVKDHIREFLLVPLNFGAVMTRDQAAIEEAQAYAPEPLWLVDEVWPWGSDVYIATDRGVPNMQTEYLSGAFMTKVFTGPFRDIGSWITQTEAFVRGHGREIDKLHFFYAT
ncbi:MAG: hydrolase [Rhodoferax sp.]